MLLYYRFQVLEDGCLIDNDTGAIIRPTEKNGKVYHLVPKGNHSNGYQYFDVNYLLEKLGVEKDTPHLGEMTEEDLPTNYKPAEILELNGRKVSDVVFDDILNDIENG